jgi:8-oxo-dGTP diphosphatase
MRPIFIHFARIMRQSRELERLSPWPRDVSTRGRPDPVSRLVVGAVIVDSIPRPTRLLAARRSRPAALAGRWEFPGGKVEAGETPQEAVVREIREELGVDIVVGEEVAENAFPIDERLELRLFCAEIIGGEPTPGESHDAVRWLALDDLTSVLWLPVDEQALSTVSTALTSP